MTFSSKENPLDIANSLEKLSTMLKKELLLVQQKFENANMNKKQTEVLGSFMNRALGQLPIDDKIDYRLAKSSMENMPEFLFF